MIVPLLIALSLGLPARPQKVSSPALAPTELTALVERVVRLAELQRRKLDLEQQLVTSRLGSEHPEAVALRLQLEEVTGALRREALQGYHGDADVLAERRALLETQLSRLRVGKSHPEYQNMASQLMQLKEQQRVTAVAALASGIEVELKAMIARQPDSALAYLELAGLYVTAGRTDEASALLTEAQAALKRSGGR